MSCIIGYADNEKVYMCYDSIEICDADHSYKVTTTDKCFIKKNILFGCVGSIRAITLFKYKLNFDLQKKGMSDHEYLSTIVIDRIRDLFVDYGCMIKNDDGEEKVLANSQMLIGYKGKLYEMYPDFYVGEIANPSYEAIGFNGSYALGSLYALESSNMTPEEKLLFSMSAVRKFAVTICEPYKIISI